MTAEIHFIQHMQEYQVDKQDIINKVNRITQWTVLTVVIFGGSCLVFISCIILIFLIVSGVR